MTDFTQWIRPAAFIVGGVALGYVFYRLVGCKTGWAITSSPVGTMIYGALIGWLLSGAIR